jgi:pimeloyl-ACP methyl ester carboxylesterase
MWHLTKPQRKKREEKWIRSSIPLWRRLNADHFSFEEEHVRHLLRLSWSWSGGVDGQADLRQMLAVLAASDRTHGLREMRKPAVVIHGTRDPLIRPAGGKDTFDAIEGAKLLLLDGMGHYTPRETWGVIVDAVDDVARKADHRVVEMVEI